MGEPAYTGISKMQVMFGVVSEGLRPVFPANTPPWYSQIAAACWRQDPKRRWVCYAESAYPVLSMLQLEDKHIYNA